MGNVVEEKLMKCRKCKKKTKHQRNNSKTGLLMMLVHIGLIAVTAGVWLIVLVVWMLLNAKIGGWRCEGCGKRA